MDGFKYRTGTRQVISGIGTQRECVVNMVKTPGRNRLSDAQEEAKMQLRRCVRAVERVVIEVGCLGQGNNVTQY